MKYSKFRLQPKSDFLSCSTGDCTPTALLWDFCPINIYFFVPFLNRDNQKHLVKCQRGNLWMSKQKRGEAGMKQTHKAFTRGFVPNLVPVFTHTQKNQHGSEPEISVLCLNQTIDGFSLHTVVLSCLVSLTAVFKFFHITMLYFYIYICR